MNSTSFWHTLWGGLLGFIVWLFVYALSHAALAIFDAARGLDGEWLQYIFRQWITPGIGGYAAIACVRRCAPKANLTWTASLVCFPIVSFYIFLSLYFIFFRASEYEFSWYEQILNWGIAASTCIGTVIGIKAYS